MLILDVEDPQAVQFLGQKPTPGARYLQIHQNMAYLADKRGGFWSLDLGDITFPITAGRCCAAASEDTSWDARDLDVEGDYVFVASPATGLRILNIEDPTSPSVVVDYGTKAYSLCHQGTSLHVGFDHALETLDVTQPSQFRARVRYLLAGTPWDVQVQARHAYLAMGTGGLLILEVAHLPYFLEPIRIAEDSVILDWAGEPATRLESTLSLEYPQWETVPDSTGRVHMRIPMARGNSFFRLSNATK